MAAGGRRMADGSDGGYAISKSDLPDRYQFDLATLKVQDDYVEAAFEVLQETSILVIWFVHVMPKTPFQRDEASRRGLIKRLGMLSKSLLSDIAHDSGSQQGVIVRQIIEVAANYLYLAEDDEAGSRHDGYVFKTLAEGKTK